MRKNYPCLLSFCCFVLVLLGAQYSNAQQVGPANAVIERNKIDGTPQSITFATPANLHRNQASDIFEQYLALKETQNELVLSSSTHTKQETIIDRYTQYYKGIKVELGGYTVMSKGDIIGFITGNFYKENPTIPVVPSLAEAKALGNALVHIGAQKYMWEEAGMELALKTETRNADTSYYPKGHLVWIEDLLSEQPDRKLHLAYAFNIYALQPLSREMVYVDAHTGKVLFANALLENTSGSGASLYSGTVNFQGAHIGSTYSLHDSTRGGGINTYSYGGGPGSSILEVTGTGATWTADAALDAHWGAEKVFDYWQSVQGRNSIDNAGMPINGYTHYLTGYNNAYWDGSKMVYGDGSGISTGGFSSLVALDVCAHEIGHGICQFTAGLIYNKESGAMNEGFSDIWGAIVENYADPHETDAVPKSMWKVGEEISASSLRRMDNPNLKTQPDTYGGTYWYGVSSCAPSSGNDYCGVHTNSGVLNYWFYLVCQGGSGTNDIGNSFSVTGIGTTEGANIAYQTELVLASNASFADCRTASINVAITLYGACSPEVEAVTRAWYAVGVGANYSGAVVAAITGAGSVCEGSTITLTDTAPGGSWSSSAGAIASAGPSTGAVTGVAGGIATITYSIGLCYATKTVTVYPTSAGTITGPLSVCTGATVTLSDMVPGGTWSSSNASIASIGSGSGVVTGLLAGTSTITYSISNVCASTYTTRGIAVNLSPAAITGPGAVCITGTMGLSSTTTGGTWASANPSVATIGISSGTVTGIASGTATISYTAGGCTITTIVTTDILSAGTISGPTSISPGATVLYISTVSGGAWSSSAASVATASASSGYVTGIATGTATISYTVTNTCGTSVATKVVTVTCPSGVDVITTILGTGAGGSGPSGIIGTSSAINAPWGVGSDAAGNVYVAEASNHRVRKVSPSGVVTDFAGTGVAGFLGDGGLATAARLSAPTGLAVFGTDVYVVDQGNARIRKINAAGIITTVAGNGSSGYSGDGMAATLTSISSPNGLCFDLAGNMYIPDQGTNRVRKVNTAGIISTIAGTGVYGYFGDGGPATLAQMKQPNGVTADNAGNLFISEYAGNRIRRVDAVTGIITTYTGNGTAGFSGDGGPASLAVINGPAGMDVDNAGNLLICDVENNRIRQINPVTGVISTFAGTGVAGFFGDGGAPTVAKLNRPHRINCDGSGNTYIADINNQRVRKVTMGAASISAPSSICVGASVTLNATPFGGTWSSSATAVVTIGSSTGIATAISPGTATITYMPFVGCMTLTTITVNSTPSAISGTLEVCSGSTTALTDLPAGGTWTSGSTGIATVGPTTGIVSGLSPGTSGITYTLGTGCKAIAVVTVETAIAIHPLHLPTNGLIAWYPFNGNAHNEYAYDEFGAGKNGRPVGPTLTTDRFGNPNSAYHFNGMSDHINEDSAFFNIGWPDYTISVWFNSDGVVNPYNVNHSQCMLNTVPHNGIGVTYNWLTTNKYSIWANSNPAVGSWDILFNSTSISTVVAGTWKHMVMVKNSPTSYSLYLNGVLDNSFTSAVTALNYYTRVCLGHIDTTISTNEGFWGKTDDYAIWRRGLSAAEVASVYNGDTASLSICVGSSVTLYYTPLGGTWSSSNSSIASVDAAGKVTGMTNGTAIITYAKSNGCGTAIATRVVTVNPVGAGPITGPSSVCVGATATLSGAVTGGTWSCSPVGIVSITSGGSITGLAQGTTVISYVANLSCGLSVATRTITVNPLPVAGVITGTTSLCEGSYTFLNDTAIGGVWNSGSPGVASVSGTGYLSAVILGVSAGTAVISYTMINSCGSAYTTAVVTVNPLPSAGAITGSGTVCVGSTVLLSDAAGPGTWASSSTGVATINSSGMVTGSNAGTTTISYGVTNGCGTTYATRVITVNTVPVAGTITATFTTCVGANTLLSNATGSPGGIWTSSATGIANVSTSGSVAGMGAGTAVISYTVANGCGSVTATAIVTVNPLPNAGTISGTPTVCVGSVTALSDLASGGTWTSSATGVATVSATGNVSGNNTGTSTISYTVTNSCGTASTSIVVTVNPLPDAGTISGVPTVCAGSVTTLSDLASAGVWTSSATGVATVSSSGVVSGGSAGTSIVSYTVTNSCGIATSSIIVTVNPLPDAGSISGTPIVCAGSTIVLSNSSSGGVWTSSVTGVASVSSAGVVSGNNAGTSVVSYAVTNSCGTASAITIVTVNPLPDAGAISGASTVCAGATTALSNLSATGTWSSSPAIIASINSSGIVSGINAGTSTIVYTVVNSCGIATASAIITVNPLPDAGAIMGSTVICNGSSTTLTASVPGGSWMSSMASVATVNSTGMVTGISTGTAAISYVIANGCGTAIATSTMSVDVAPDPGVITGSASVCLTGLITLSNSIGGGTWSATGSASVSTAGVVSGTGIGTATITYTVAGLCSSSMTTRVITVTDVPYAGIITGIPTVCQGYSTALTDASASGVWASSNSLVASVGAPGVITGMSPGTATISYIVSNACGSAAATKVVTVNAWPDAGFISGPVTVCAGAAISITTTASGGTWLSGAAGIATVGSAGVVTGVAGGVVDIAYTLTNGCGTASSHRIITVNALPDAGTISGVPVLCSGGFTPLVDIAPGGTWSALPASIITIGATGVVSGVSAGVGSVYYAVTNMCGTTTATTTVTVNPLPDAGIITGTSNLCAGATSALSGSVPGGIWSGGAAGIATVSSTGLVTGVSAGTAYISYSVANTCGTAYALRVVTVNPLPDAGSITGADVVCAGAAIPLAATAAGGTWASSAIAIATVNSAGLVTGVATGQTDISYTVANGCGEAAVVHSVTVNPLPDPGIIRSAGTMCTDVWVVLTSSQPDGAWTSSKPTVASVEGDGTAHALSAGETIISYAVTNSCGTVAAIDTITVVAPPQAAVIMGTAKICSNSATLLSTSVIGGSWSIDNSNIATVTQTTLSQVSVNALTVGTATVSYAQSNMCGNAYATAVVTVMPVPYVSPISGQATMKVGETATFTDSVINGVWSSNTGSIATISADGMVTGIASGTTIISYKVSTDCGFAVATLPVTVDEVQNTIEFAVFPNPTQGDFIVRTPTPGVFIIFTEDGKELQRHKVVTGNNPISLQRDLAAATYMCRFVGIDGDIKGLKLIYIH